MGLIGAAFGLGFVLGPALGGILSQYSLSLPPFAAAGLAAANGIAAWFILPEPEERSVREQARAGRFAEFFHEMKQPGIRRLVVVYGVSVLAFSAMEATYALLVTKHYGLDIKHAYRLFAFIGVILVVVQGGLIGRLTRALGEKTLLIAGLALQAAALALLPFAGTTVGLVLATAPLAVGAGLSNPSLTALMSRFARSSDQGGTLGIGESASALGRVLGPIFGTLSFTNVWFAFPYLGAAALMAASAAVAAVVRPGAASPKELADAGAA
jgi:predicted MFS family arabinose efflux permease